MADSSILGPNITKLKQIGKGTSGSCYLVRKNDDGKLYVVKTVDLSKLNKKERTQSLNEARILSLLRNPGVISYYDSYLSKKSDHLCIVMEYADGGDLSHKVKAAHGVPFSEEQVLDWMIQGALALNHVHSRHVIHRDVKTQNFFIQNFAGEGGGGSGMLLKLGDFGIARTLQGANDLAKTFVGTPYYLSPELILEKPYDFMSDVWAYGVCIYELMALKHPFNAGDMKGLMQKILRVQYDPLPQVYSKELRDIVARILVKDPANRMRLTDLLQQPIVINRMRKWMVGGILPPKYIAALVRYKLLPSAVEPPQQLVQNTLPAIHNNNHLRQNMPPLGNNNNNNSNKPRADSSSDSILSFGSDLSSKHGGVGAVRASGVANTARPSMPPPPTIGNKAFNQGGGPQTSRPTQAPGMSSLPPLQPHVPNKPPSGHGLPPLPGGGGSAHGPQNQAPRMPPLPVPMNAGTRRGSFHFPPPPPIPNKAASAMPPMPAPPQFQHQPSAQSSRLPALPSIGNKHGPASF